MKDTDKAKATPHISEDASCAGSKIKPGHPDTERHSLSLRSKILVINVGIFYFGIHWWSMDVSEVFKDGFENMGANFHFGNQRQILVERIFFSMIGMALASSLIRILPELVKSTSAGDFFARLLSLREWLLLVAVTSLTSFCVFIGASQ